MVGKGIILPVYSLVTCVFIGPVNVTIDYWVCRLTRMLLQLTHASVSILGLAAFLTIFSFTFREASNKYESKFLKNLFVHAFHLTQASLNHYRQAHKTINIFIIAIIAVLLSRWLIKWFIKKQYFFGMYLFYLSIH